MDLSVPVYSAYLGAFLIALQTILAAIAGGHRGRHRKGIGCADDPVLERKVRRHANMAEYAPIFLIVVALFELIAGQTQTIFWLCIVFAASRILHLIGFSSSAGSHLVDPSGSRWVFVLARMAGAGLTLLSSIILAIALALHVSTLP